MNLSVTKNLKLPPFQNTEAYRLFGTPAAHRHRFCSSKSASEMPTKLPATGVLPMAVKLLLSFSAPKHFYWTEMWRDLEKVTCVPSTVYGPLHL